MAKEYVSPERRLEIPQISLDYQRGNLPRLHACVDPLGGCVTAFRFGEQDVIVPRCEENKKRSGIPRLGPVAGPVKGQAWECFYPEMPSHGTDRLEPMGVVWMKENEVLLEKAEGPRRFRGAWQTSLRIGLSYDDAHLEIVQAVENLESGPRERAVAFHPYFLNSGNLLVTYPETLTMAPDIKDARIIDGVPQIIYSVDGCFIHVKFMPMPLKIVDWRADDGHRCLEPWWADLGKGIIFGPHEKKTFRMGIKVYPPES